MALGCLAIASWCSTGLLVRAALQKPRIGALTERAVIAVILAIIGAISVVIVWNTESGFALFPTEVARTLFRVGLFVMFAIPLYWLWLFVTNRLGDGQ